MPQFTTQDDRCHPPAPEADERFPGSPDPDWYAEIALAEQARREATTQAAQLVAAAYDVLCDAFDECSAGKQLAELVMEYRPKASALPTPKKRTIGPTLRLAVYARDGYRCVRCGTNEELSADHVIPESKGGATTLDNLQTLCLTCNRRKGPRHE